MSWEKFQHSDNCTGGLWVGALLGALLLFKFYQTNPKNTLMTAHTTYRVNPHYPRATAHQECCICNGAIGLYIFYYDRGDTHYTGACHDCIEPMRAAARKLYVVKETYSKFAPTKYSPQTIVSKMKIFDGPRPCGACDQHMINHQMPNTRTFVYIAWNG